MKLQNPSKMRSLNVRGYYDRGYVVNVHIIYWSARSSSWRGINGVKGLEEGIVILASYTFYFIREHENLV